MDLSALTTFGLGDAESEQRLAAYFLETPSYEGIEAGRRLVVCGRKGSGKTAIYRTLLERAAAWSNVHAVGIPFDGYASPLVTSDDRDRVSVGSVTEQWRFVLLLELAKLVLRTGIAVGSRRRKRQLRRFIENNWGDLDGELHATFAPAKYSFVLEPTAFGFSLGSLRRERIPREQLGAILPRVNLWLKATLGSMLPEEDAQIFLLLDDLDAGWDAEDATARARIVGLLVAARDVRIWAAPLRCAVLPVLFLRSDVLAEVQFEGKNKVITDLVEHIRWQGEDHAEADLRCLLVQRIQALIGSRYEVGWDDVFEAYDETQPNVYDAMVALTQLRPRDMIELANFALKQAQATRAPRIGRNHVEASLPEYSAYLLREIADVAHQGAASWPTCEMTLRRMGLRQFTRPQLEAAHGNSATVEQTLRTLYIHGTIGYWQREQLVFGFQEELPFDPSASTYEIHPGLCCALGVTEPSGGDTHPD
jgi:hypothetical protein